MILPSWDLLSFPQGLCDFTCPWLRLYSAALLPLSSSPASPHPHQQVPTSASRLTSKVTFFNAIPGADLATLPLYTSIASTLFIQRLFIQLVLCASHYEENINCIYTLGIDHERQTLRPVTQKNNCKLRCVWWNHHLCKKKHGLLWTNANYSSYHIVL